MSQRSNEEILGEALITMGEALRQAGKELRRGGIAKAAAPLPSPLLQHAANTKVQQLRALVMQRVTARTGVPERLLQTNSRIHEVVEARWLCWHILQRLTGMSTPQLGRIFNHHYDHSTVMNGLQKIRQRRGQEPERYSWVEVVVQEGREFIQGGRPPEA